MFIDEVMKRYPDMSKPDAVFNIQNVDSYINTIGAGTGEDLGFDKFCKPMPPFQRTWFEFKYSKHTYNGPIGIMARYIDCTNQEAKKLIGSIPYSGITDFSSLDKGNDIKFCITLDYFLSFPFIIKSGGNIFFLNSQGEMSKDAVAPNGASVILRMLSRELQQMLKIENDDFKSSPWPALFADRRVVLALNFLHCKNVFTQENHISEKLVKANLKRGKPRPYFEKYYTLQIEPMKKILNTEGQAQSVGLKKAFHICRGHFKTYDANPLFGKVKGTFWTPAHVKGSIEKGVIKKDYKIKI